MASKQSNSKVCLDILPTATDFASTKDVRHKWKALCVYVDRGKQQAEGKRVAPCQNIKLSALGPLSSRTEKQMARLLVGMYKLSKLF